MDPESFNISRTSSYYYHIPTNAFSSVSTVSNSMVKYFMPFLPGHVQTYTINPQGEAFKSETKRFLSIGSCDPTIIAKLLPKDPCANIRLLLKKAVKQRLLADRRIVCLLSGGLAKHLDTEHHKVRFTSKEGIDALHKVIYAVETFDIGTIRSSLPMYMVSKYIKEKQGKCLDP